MTKEVFIVYLDKSSSSRNIQKQRWNTKVKRHKLKGRRCLFFQLPFLLLLFAGSNVAAAAAATGRGVGGSGGIVITAFIVFRGFPTIGTAAIIQKESFSVAFLPEFILQQGQKQVRKKKPIQT
jgi:hypothetical protein